MTGLEFFITVLTVVIAAMAAIYILAGLIIHYWFERKKEYLGSVAKALAEAMDAWNRSVKNGNHD